MHGRLRVASPPARPLLVFDGDCNFCRLWVGRWRQWTGDAVDYLPAQDPSIAIQYPEITRDQLDAAVHLILPNGQVCLGAEAVFCALAAHPTWQWLPRIYEAVPLLAELSEGCYRLVASHRTAFSRLTRWCSGPGAEPPGYRLVGWLFMRALGGVYLVAFISLWTQVHGLIGSNGLLPTDRFMAAAAQECTAQGIGADRYHLLPTLCWFNASDASLGFQCAAGTMLAALLLLGVAPVPCLALLWVLYLSLVTVGRNFFEFQWDSLLLETGFLAIFLAPWQWLSRPARAAPVSSVVRWLLWLLLFKLMFMSGWVKLRSGDPNWRNLTALKYHYWTQPLPPWTAWYANQLPVWFHKVSCAAMFAIELGLPFLLFAPRRLRFLAGAGVAGLQFLILATGNYGFFNWLTLALCLLLLDDAALLQCVPARLRSRMRLPPGPNRHLSRPRPVIAGLALLIPPISLCLLASALNLRSTLFAPFQWAAAQLAPFRIVNGYGLFAVMTTTRNEIILEGSNDRLTWRPYEFNYKPGEVGVRPTFVAPFQPRLDWQMWFASLGRYQDNPWLIQCCERLLEGSPEVLALLAKNPFPDQPPRYLRAAFYSYQFTSWPERRAGGAWWKRERLGDYMPVMSLPPATGRSRANE